MPTLDRLKDVITLRVSPYVYMQTRLFNLDRILKARLNIFICGSKLYCISIPMHTSDSLIIRRAKRLDVPFFAVDDGVLLGVQPRRTRINQGSGVDISEI